MAVIAVLVSGSLILAACGSNGSSGDKADRTLVVAAADDPETFNPQLLDTRANFEELINIYEPLIQRDNDNELKGLLAESWETSGKTTWEFKLRSGVKFHNGEDFNAESAAISINRIIDPAFKSAFASLFDTVKEARAVDATTLEVETKVPDPILPARLPMVSMIPAKASQEPDFGENPVGTGPYKFVKYDQGQQTLMEKFDDYWGGNPEDGLNGPATIEKLEFRVMKSPQARLAALRSGEVDIVRDVMFEDAESLKHVVEVAGNDHAVIKLANSGVLADPRVRQAANYAVDKEAILESIFGGHGELLDSQIENPAVFGYNPDMEPYPYDPEKAKQLAAEAGAEKISFKILGEANNNWVKSRELVEAVAGQLRENLGWDVQPEILNWSKFLDLFFGEQGVQMATVLYSGNEFMDADRNLSSYATLDAPASTYHNKEIQAQLEAARQELDPTTRENMYHKILKYVGEDDPMAIFVARPAFLYGFSDGVTYQPRMDKALIAANATID